jgi:fructose-1,6-bisphosphatase/inositol monophosphatase family enzyme
MNRFLRICIDAAVSGAQAAVSASPTRIKEKHDPHVGHHAIVSAGDFRSQFAILKVLTNSCPESFLLMEEAVKDRQYQQRLLASNTIDYLRTQGAFIVDELDGSSSWAAGHYEWSVSVGYVEGLIHVAGALFAPDVWGGALFFASRSGGAFLRKSNGSKAIGVAPSKLRSAYILIGPDMYLGKYPRHNKFLVSLANVARTVNCCGSCALAMGVVAAGRANAIVQPPQSPWDWAAGRVIIEEAGGVVLFYEVARTGIVPVDILQPAHYDPGTRKVGFVAGPRRLAREILDLLCTAK